MTNNVTFFRAFLHLQTRHPFGGVFFYVSGDPELCSMLSWKTNLYPVMWVPDLDILEIQTDAASVSFSISILNGATASGEVFRETYYPVAGVVSIWELERMLKNYVSPVYRSVVVILKAETDEAVITYSTLAVGLNAISPGPCQDYLNTHFPVSVTGPKITAPDRTELLPIFITPGGTAGDLAVSADYLTADGEITRHSEILQTITAPVGPISVCTTSVDVSPAKFENPEKGQLLGYTVTLGQRRQRFDIPERTGIPSVCFRFLNRFGFFETACFSGPTTRSLSVERKELTVCRRLLIYDRKETVENESSSGIWPDPMLPLAEALAVSDTVYVDPGDGESEVVITENNIATDNSGLNKVSVKWQIRRRGVDLHPESVPGRIFDSSFDNSFG